MQGLFRPGISGVSVHLAGLGGVSEKKQVAEEASQMSGRGLPALACN
jgi:hypothetical protein